MTSPKMYHKVLLLDDESDDAGSSVAVVSAGAIVESVDPSARTIAFSETTSSPFVFVTRTESFDASFY